MVVRKPTPAGAFIPVSISSRPHPDPAMLSHHPHQSVPQESSSIEHTIPRSPAYAATTPNDPVEKPQPYGAISEFGCPSVREQNANAKPFLATAQEDKTINSLEELYTGNGESQRPGLSSSEKATPRSSIDSGRSRDFWEEDLPGSKHFKNDTSQSQQPLQLEIAATTTSEQTVAPSPPIMQASEPPASAKRSNNPFRRENAYRGPKTSLEYRSDDFVFYQNAHEVQSPETPIELTANLTLADRPFSEYSASFHPSTLNLNNAFQKQEPERTLELAEDNSSQPPPSSFKDGVDSHPAPLVLTSMNGAVDNGIGSLHSALSKGPAQDSIPIRESARSPIVSDLEKALPATPAVDTASNNASYEFPKSIKPALASPRQYTASSPGTSAGQAHLLENPPPSLPRPKRSRSRIAEAEMSKLREQRNETYQIKQFNWFDHNSRTLRRSSMLTQNENGPCPLLALVNALILGNDSRSALGTALQTREQVSLGLIIESLMDELTSEERGMQLTALPDVDELNRFLLMLHTGMTANPRLAPATAPSPNLMDARNSSLHLPLSLNNDRRPGTFEETQAMRLYGAFGIPLVHGWLAPRSDPARAAFLRSAPTYEDAQTILFREDELEEKLSRVGLNAEEQQLLQDVSSIKTFLESYPTQITPFGLDIINESLFPASACILFRNDHFSTIYKHPESGQLFTLVTDAGYSDRDEVIWESLVDVSGQDGEFFSGDFRPIGHAEGVGELREGRSDGSSTNSATPLSTQSYGVASATSPQEQQQQADADFAMALQLQEEEEARMDDSRRRSAVNDLMTGRNSGRSNSSRPRDQEAARPPIPPRNVRGQGVTRPVDPNSDEAPPPAYEEAAKGRPYLPPSGHPQHPSFDGRSPTSGPPTPMHPPGPGVRQAIPRRMSAFQETSQFQPSPPLTRPQSNNNFGVAQSSGRPRDREKDCIIM